MTFNLVSPNGSTFSLTYNKSVTLGFLADDVQNNKGVIIAAITVGSKVWKVEEHKNKTLKEMGITKGLLVHCILRFKGGAGSS